MFKQSTEKEIIDKIINYQQFLKKWEDPELSRFQHIEKIPYMKMAEDEKKEDEKEDKKEEIKIKNV